MNCPKIPRALKAPAVKAPSRPATGHHSVWLTGWDSGDVASSELARRIDITQMLAVLALRVGAARAVHSVADALAEDDVAAARRLLADAGLAHELRADER